ncbi:MAG: type II toxin-antitoxin system VapC family toxin [Prosthecobacter sp.]|nr:type II toxin-antitoxin system VapC family toxin [Prosthecobacter sp.]
MSAYADTNFITRLYLERPETAQAEKVFGAEQPVLPIIWLTRLEVINAFEQSVLTGFGEAQARVSAELAAACQQQFRDDLTQGLALRLVNVSLAEISAKFEDISLRHTARHGFRAYDILHVAAALALKCERFWSCCRVERGRQ